MVALPPPQTSTATPQSTGLPTTDTTSVLRLYWRSVLRDVALLMKLTTCVIVSRRRVMFLLEMSSHHFTALCKEEGGRRGEGGKGRG